MTDVAEVLDRIAPPYDGAGDWDRVLRDAGLERRSRRLPLRLAAAVALVAAVIGDRRALAVRRRAERDRPGARGDR